MAISAELVQAFNDPETTAEKPQPLVFDQYILPWANELKGKDIVDLAAGDCVEAKLLAEKGFNCLAIDASPVRLQEGNYPNSRLGTVDKIDLPDSSIDGFLLKDTMVFLPPETRDKMLKEINRTLKPGGSLLVISQQQVGLKVQFVPKDSKLPAKEVYPPGTTWQDVAPSFKDDQIIATEFPASPQTSMSEAVKTGFEYQTLVEYDYNNPLAQENRWIKRPGFIGKFTKPA